jgi:Tol biopolymer transport system component/DNA-binding winged helix-turn-helix (wHTH) protein
LQVMRPTPINRTFRFGDFEFSVRAGELRRDGVVVRLQYQPLRVLLVLLENSGEVLSREEIRQQVWQDADIQDFDNSLRVAVAKLRQALEDDPDIPRYIETLPRRGYRWLYPMTFQDSPALQVETTFPSADGYPGFPKPDATSLEGPDEPKVLRDNLLVRSLVLTVLLWAVAFVTWRYLRPQPELPDPKVVPLTTYLGIETMPSLSPDGKRVAFAWTGPNSGDPYGVYFRPIADDRPHRLVETPAGAADGDPVWAPDGKSIYFFRRGGEHPGIYIASIAGGHAHLVVETSFSGGRRVRRARFDVSPTGKTLVYPDELPGQETIALFLLDLGTLQKRQITNPPPSSEGDGDPAISHDGKTLAFQRDTVDLGEVYVMSLGGGAARLLTSTSAPEFIDGLAWTTNDHEIVLGGKRLRRISVDRDKPSITNVTFVPGPAEFPSVRDHSLAYVQATTNANIWKLDLRDLVHPAGEQSLLISSTRQQAAAAFSPDGSRIAFQSDRSGSWEIWTCSSDGSNAVQLTHFGEALTGTPRWAPDGKQIAFDSQENGIAQIDVVSAEGGEPRRLTNGQDGGEVPSWSRDGKWIYYSTSHKSAANIWKVPVAGGPAQPMTKNSGIYAVESLDRQYLYYSRGEHDSTIWRIPIAGGPEEKVPGAPKPFDTSHWSLVASGIYVVDGNGDLLFYKFGTVNVTKVLHDGRFLTDWSMAVSPDGREIVWAQVDENRADLMLVENFR